MDYWKTLKAYMLYALNRHIPTYCHDTFQKEVIITVLTWEITNVEVEQDSKWGLMQVAQ